MEALRTHWGEPPGADQQLLLMRFYGNMTQTQIAGVTDAGPVR